MSEHRSHSDYLQKAAMYDLLAHYYKYMNPQHHIHYYLKHLNAVNKAMEIMQSTSAFRQKDATVRFLHTSPDSPNVDIYLNGQRVINDLSFRKVSTNLQLKSGKYHIDIYPSGNMIDSALNKKITVETGKSYTLAIIGQATKMRLLVFENNPAVPLNETKIRFIHLSPDTAALDVAVKDRDVVYPKLTYKQATSYLGLTPMTVDLEAREAGTKTVILSMPKLHFKANESYTIVFVGLSNEQSGLQMITIID